MTHGANSGPRYPSYWKQTNEPSEFPPANGPTSVDVAVVGGGITGLTTAFLLKRAGLRVAVLEADRVGGGATGGSFGRLSALDALAYATIERERGPEAARTYAAANQWGLAQISDTVHDLDIDCGLTTRPALAYTAEPDGVEEIEREVAAARRAGLAVERVDDSDLPFSIEAGAYLPGQAHFDPLRYCLALARFVDGDGSAVFEGSRVTGVAEDTEPLSVQTRGNARILASWVVMSCGLPPLDRGGFFARTVPVRSHCVAIEARAEDLPDSMAMSSHEPFRWLQAVPRPGERPLLLVGGEDHRLGEGADARDRYARLEAFARQHFPVGEVAACWSTQDYATTDGIPMIGRVPFGSSHLLVATGLRRGGLTLGPAAARILSEMVMERPSPWTGLFEADRSRFTPAAWESARTQTSAARRMGRGRTPQGDLAPPETVPPGSAAICSRDGESVAVFREEDGTLHVVSSICTHRGYQVAWNPVDRTWDCPCHGSRFGIDGQVLHGPAVFPLRGD
jgi:glycine/D-amino acid oxidase-like deaminating enzyme/nitrite reductase/ring-hydroxylating ferredoxin subunit